MPNANILQRGEPVYGMTPCSLCKHCTEIDIRFGVVFYECEAWGTFRAGEARECARFEMDRETAGEGSE